VRISVLEILARENPRWTLADALEHLKGNDDVVPKRELERESSFEGSEVSEPVASPETVRLQPENVVKVEAEPLMMELSYPGMGLDDNITLIV